ncbi:MAG: hypothetical protein V3T11_00790, partial [Roseateles sp.]
MAKVGFIKWQILGLVALAWATAGHAAEPAAADPRWAQMPRLYGRITARELGLVINTADPYSVSVGEYYARRRGIPEAQVVRV